MASVSFFVKKLPTGCTESDLRDAFGTCGGTITHVKVLKGRRAFVDLTGADSARTSALIAAGSLIVRDVVCPVGLNTSPAGAAARADPRQLRRHACPLCGLEFASARKLAAHAADGPAHRPPPPEWTPARFDEFDLSPQTMVAALDERALALLDCYLAHALPQWPEMARIVARIAARHPTSLRLKELCETVELFLVVGQFFFERWRRHGLTTLLDLACGHGLLGVLLAYRFPMLQVVCVDLEARSCWAHYRDAWLAEGRAAEGHDSPLGNLEFRVADVADVTRWGRRDVGDGVGGEGDAGSGGDGRGAASSMGPHVAVVCCHACNEANIIVLRNCRAAGATWAVMPCCLPSIYNTDCRHLADDGIRYSVMVGVIAGQYAAAKVRSIDARITNRNLCVMGPLLPRGGVGGGGDGGEGGRGDSGRTHRTPILPEPRAHRGGFPPSRHGPETGAVAPMEPGGAGPKGA